MSVGELKPRPWRLLGKAHDAIQGTISHAEKMKLI